jgi:hypothetical protein
MPITPFHMGSGLLVKAVCAVSLDFRFLLLERVVKALIEAGLVVLERVEREPYPEVEHASRRGYLLARAP